MYRLDNQKMGRGEKTVRKKREERWNIDTKNTRSFPSYIFCITIKFCGAKTWPFIKSLPSPTRTLSAHYVRDWQAHFCNIVQKHSESSSLLQENIEVMQARVAGGPGSNVAEAEHSFVHCFFMGYLDTFIMMMFVPNGPRLPVLHCKILGVSFYSRLRESGRKKEER